MVAYGEENSTQMNSDAKDTKTVKLFGQKETSPYGHTYDSNDICVNSYLMPVDNHAIKIDDDQRKEIDSQHSISARSTNQQESTREEYIY